MTVVCAPPRASRPLRPAGHLVNGLPESSETFGSWRAAPWGLVSAHGALAVHPLRPVYSGGAEAPRGGAGRDALA